jgi:hypothetical protein
MATAPNELATITTDSAARPSIWRRIADRPYAPETLVTALYALGTLVVLLPFLVYRYPLVVDYLPHVAWIRVLVSPPESPLRRVFDVRWAIVPNLGLPLFAFALDKVLSPGAILSTYNLLGIIGVAAGALLLSRSINGRIQPTVLLILPILHSSIVTAGLYNFAFGVAVVLLLLSAIQRAGFRYRLIILNLCAPVLFFIHLGALACMAATVLLLEAERQKPKWRGFVIAPFYFLSVVPLYKLRTEPPIAYSAVFSNLPTKLIAISTIFDSGSMAIALLCTLVGAAVAGLLYLRGVSSASGWKTVAVGLWLAAFAAPFILENSSGVDCRTFWYAALITIAAARVPEAQLIFSTRLIFCATLAMLLIKEETATRLWPQYDHNVDEIASAVQIIPPGAPVFVALAPLDAADCTRDSPARVLSPRFYWHISAIASLSDHGLDSMFFAQRGSVIIEPRSALGQYFSAAPTTPPSAPLAAYFFDHDASWGLLRVLVEQNYGLLTAPGSDFLDYMLDWGKRYTYLIYLDMGCAENPFSSKLRLIARGSFFKIYRNPAANTDLFQKVTR